MSGAAIYLLVCAERIFRESNGLQPHLLVSAYVRRLQTSCVHNTASKQVHNISATNFPVHSTSIVTLMDYFADKVSQNIVRGSTKYLKYVDTNFEIP